MQTGGRGGGTQLCDEAVWMEQKRSSIMSKDMGLVPAPTHPYQIVGCVTWDQSHILSEPQFSHLLNADVLPIL